MIKQTSGNYDIIDFGMAMTFGSDDGIELNVNFEDKIEFVLSISFSDIEGEKKVSIDVDEKNNSINVVFVDEKNSIGYGINRPVEIAMIENKKIFFRIWISPLGRENRAKKIEYVFFKEK